MSFHDRTVKWDGKQITKPGIYSNIPLQTYHRADICDGPSLSSSGMRAIFGTPNSSPKHFYAKWSGNPNRIIKPDPKHFIIGRALHHLLLGEAFFANLFVVRPHEWPDEDGVLRPWNTNRPTHRKWIREQETAGRAVLSPTDAETLKQMAISVDNHPLVKQGALNGAVERSLFWKDKETGIWLKSRPDAIPTSSADFTDLKTTIRTQHWSLSKTLEEYGYFQQTALVNEASREVLKMRMESFTYIFVEKSDPWHTRDYRLFDEDIKRGEKANRIAIRTFVKCLKDNHWPGPGDGNEGNERLGLSDAARERLDKAITYADPAGE